MCQVDWPTGYPDICLNIILGHLWRCFCMRLTFKLVESLKYIALHHVLCVGVIQSVEGLNRPKGWIRENSLSLPVLALGPWSFSAFRLTQAGIYTIGSLDSQAFGLRMELYHHLPWVCSLLTANTGPQNRKAVGIAQVQGNVMSHYEKKWHRTVKPASMGPGGPWQERDLTFTLKVAGSTWNVLIGKLYYRFHIKRSF